MTRRSVLVTGSAGFIGGNFVRIFKKRFPRMRVVGIDIKKSSAGEHVFYRGSITDEKLLARIFKKHRPQYVFHFAAIPRVTYSVLHPAETALTNVYGTALLLEKCRDFRVKRLIFSSSSSVYGGAKKLPTKESENPPNPRSPYAAHKYAGEILCRLSSELHGVDTVSLRYFNVYGPGQYGDAPYSTVMSAWLQATLFPKRGMRPFLEGDGKQSRDFSYVDDVVQANILAMLHRSALRGEAFNIGAGSRTDLRTVRRLIEAKLGRTLNIELRKQRPGDVRHTQADISKARRVLRYRPRVMFPEGATRMVEWFTNIARQR